MAGELHDNAEARSITPNGAESPRLVVSNSEMATFQSTTLQSGTIAVTDREQAMFGQSGHGFSFGQFDNVYGKAGADAIVAWDPNKMLRDTGEAALEKTGFFAHRGHEDDFVDYKAAQQAWHLAGLDKLGVPKNTVGAILRNEEHFYKKTDEEQDKQVREKGTVLEPDGTEDTGASIGPAQMQIRNIHRLVDLTDAHGKPVYPFLQHMKDDPIRAALEPKNAALLVAAQLVEIAKDQKTNGGIDKPTVQQFVYGYNDDVHSYSSGKDRAYISRDPVQLRAERVMHPDLRREMYPTNRRILDTSVHVQHVMSQLKILDSSQR